MVFSTCTSVPSDELIIVSALRKVFILSIYLFALSAFFLSILHNFILFSILHMLFFTYSYHFQDVILPIFSQKHFFSPAFYTIFSFFFYFLFAFFAFLYYNIFIIG